MAENIDIYKPIRPEEKILDLSRFAHPLTERDRIWMKAEPEVTGIIEVERRFLEPKPGMRYGELSKEGYRERHATGINGSKLDGFYKEVIAYPFPYKPITSLPDNFGQVIYEDRISHPNFRFHFSSILGEDHYAGIDRARFALVRKGSHYKVVVWDHEKNYHQIKVVSPEFFEFAKNLEADWFEEHAHLNRDDVDGVNRVLANMIYKFESNPIIARIRDELGKDNPLQSSVLAFSNLIGGER